MEVIVHYWSRILSITVGMEVDEFMAKLIHVEAFGTFGLEVFYILVSKSIF